MSTDAAREEQTEEAGRELVRRVSDLAVSGKSNAAKAAFTRSWREAVPDRQPHVLVTLRDLDLRVTRALARHLLGGGGELPLRLRYSRDGSISVLVCGKRDRRLGDLAAEDAARLDRSAGYTPFLLQIKPDQAELVCAVVLVPEESDDASGGMLALHEAVDMLSTGSQAHPS